MQKTVFWGVNLGGPWGMVSPNSVKILAYKYLLISKNTGTLNEVIQKIDLGGLFWSSRGGGNTKPRQYICLLNIY